jgi:hypothetical protein
MTDEPEVSQPANSAFRVLAAIADLGEATAAAIAEKAGLGYSTVTPKLRAWENTGQAEKYYNEDKSQTLWRLTAAGKTATATPASQAAVPAEDGATAESGAAQPAKREGRETAVEPGQDHPVGDEPDAAEPTHYHAGPAPVLPPDAATPSTGDADQAVDASGTATADAPDVSPAPAPAGGHTLPAADDTFRGTAGAVTPARRRRPKGALEASALAILQANPDTEYKVGEMKAAIDEADADTGYARASDGAVMNALDKLVREDKAVLVQDRRAATFRLAPATD